MGFGLQGQRGRNAEIKLITGSYGMLDLQAPIHAGRWTNGGAECGQAAQRAHDSGCLRHGFGERSWANEQANRRLRLQSCA